MKTFYYGRFIIDFTIIDHVEVNEVKDKIEAYVITKFSTYNNVGHYYNNISVLSGEEAKQFLKEYKEFLEVKQKYFNEKHSK